MEGLNGLNMGMTLSGAANANFGQTYGSELFAPQTAIAPPPVDTPPSEGGYSPSAGGWSFENVEK